MINCTISVYNELVRTNKENTNNMLRSKIEVYTKHSYIIGQDYPNGECADEKERYKQLFALRAIGFSVTLCQKLGRAPKNRL